MASLDTLIHQPVRLRIVASLSALPEDGSAEFTFLRDLHDLTDGNLGAHLRKLEEAGYVSLEKTFIERKPRTFIAITRKGRKAFMEHVEALELILKDKS
ncbi:MAG: transcriptional regulator [Anaerolineales bacterium]